MTTQPTTPSPNDPLKHFRNDGARLAAHAITELRLTLSNVLPVLTLYLLAPRIDPATAAGLALTWLARALRR